MQTQTSDFYKYWNKYFRSCLTTAVDTFNIRSVISTSSLPCFTFVGYQWHGNSVIVFTVKADTLTLILLTWRIWWAPNNASKWQMGFNSAFKGLTVKTAEFGILKIHAHCIGILCIHQNWFLMHSVSKTNE